VGYGFGISVVTRRPCLAGMITILMTQRAWAAPHPPEICLDRVGGAYVAIDDEEERNMTEEPSERRPPTESRASADVERLLAALDHPRKPEILALRQIILGADPRIAEEVKWNAPSFRTTEHFATFHLRAKGGVQVVLHLGAKPRETPGRLPIDDPLGLLTWRSNDRALAQFADLREVEARREALAAIIRQWIAHVPA
jgi:hypothetical protein